MGPMGPMGPIGPMGLMRPMRPMRPIGLIGLIAGLLLAACTSEDPASEKVEPTVTRQIAMTICLQPNIDMTALGGEEGSESRAYGDPGTYEKFGFPRYFYIYVVGFTDPEGAYPEASGGTVIPLQDAGGHDVNRLDIGEDPEVWLKYLMTVDPPQTLLDSIYGSTQYISLSTSAAFTKLRLYVAASPTPLKYNGHELGVKVDEDDQVFKTGEKNETDVLNLKFDVDNALKARLQDLYSSPYNYAPGGEPYRSSYYYTITDPTAKIEITRILYHVASKVDVMWNVAPEQQSTLQLSYIQARKLKQKDCLLFRPVENTWTSTDDANNYSLELMKDDIGRQWYGREYFYTIFYKNENKFDVNLHILKNGDSPATYEATGYNLRIRKNMATASTIFVPWQRTDLKFTTGVSSLNYTDEDAVNVTKEY